MIRKTKAVYVWALRTIERHPVLFRGRRRLYFAKQTSIKNPRYLTQIHYAVKYFVTQEAALTYYMQKARAHPTIENCTAVRIKVFVSYHNEYDYWKNSSAWRLREKRDWRP